MEALLQYTAAMIFIQADIEAGRRKRAVVSSATGPPWAQEWPLHCFGDNEFKWDFAIAVAEVCV